MFTGIVEEIGSIASVRRGQASSTLTVTGKAVLENTYLGDSIAVDGVCLTVTQLTKTSFSADVMHETLKRSTLGELKPNTAVNLERALPANGRFGGHIVSGHIDGRGTIRTITKDDTALWYTIETSKDLLRYIIQKGSIALDGISLTVAGVTEQGLSVSLIPHTAATTTLSQKKVGDAVNLEVDLIGKYVERLLELDGSKTFEANGRAKSGANHGERSEKHQQAAGSTITAEFLARQGF
ncbi:MAG: riboflavin synthase [Coriobacteriales bacterium]|jgi:riboflavin synthase|nr:riboflavin synthase [Coriobacteriales bacterium]